MSRLSRILLLAGVLSVLGVASIRMAADRGDTSPRSSGPSEEREFAGRVLDEPWPRPDFTLTTTDGEPFDFSAETAGRLTLLFFGYTSCPDVCPIHLATLADSLARPGVPDPVVVFVGIDPARDTPVAMRSFLDNFNQDFIGLVGTEAQLRAAQEATGVPVAFADPPDPDGDYLVGHASQIIAYTPDDLAHVVYPFGVRQQDWARDLPRLATQSWDGSDASG